jgi:hypothetical protein
MNYCGHCGTRLEPSGRCPTCAAAEHGIPRIVEQTASPPPPPPPPADVPHTVTPPPTLPVQPEPAATVATPVVASPVASTSAFSRQANQPTQILTQVEPAESWGVVREDDDLLLDDPQSWRRSQLATVGVIAAILLLAGLGVVLWNLLAEDPDSLATVPDISTTVATAETDTTPPPTTLPAPGTTTTRTLPDLTPLTIAPTVPTLVPQTSPGTLPPVIVTVTIPRTTVPGTTPGTAAPPIDDTVADTTQVTDPVDPPPTEPPPTEPPPPPPTAPPAGQNGTPLVLQDPVPSGMPYSEVQSAHLLAQRLADALATEDWDTARALSPALAGSSDATLANGYGGLDRASLVLVDARPEENGSRLLIVSVANEIGFSRTSLYCFEWSAQPGAGTVRQAGGVGRIAQVSGTWSADDVRNDPNLGGAVRNDCFWS